MCIVFDDSMLKFINFLCVSLSVYFLCTLIGKYLWNKSKNYFFYVLNKLHFQSIGTFGELFLPNKVTTEKIKNKNKTVYDQFKCYRNKPNLTEIQIIIFFLLEIYNINNTFYNIIIRLCYNTYNINPICT